MNTKAFLLDNHRNPVGMGEIGEIYLSGDCLARGYASDKSLTPASLCRATVLFIICELQLKTLLCYDVFILYLRKFSSINSLEEKDENRGNF